MNNNLFGLYTCLIMHLKSGMCCSYHGIVEAYFPQLDAGTIYSKNQLQGMRMQYTFHAHLLLASCAFAPHFKCLQGVSCTFVSCVRHLCTFACGNPL